MKPEQMTLDKAIPLLDRLATKHWNLQAENDGNRRRFSCTVWSGGRRFSVERPTPIDAVNAAIDKIKVSGTFDTYLSGLATKGFIKRGKGRVELAPLLRVA